MARTPTERHRVFFLGYKVRSHSYLVSVIGLIEPLPRL